MAMTYTTLSAAKTSGGSIRRWLNYSELDVDHIIDEAQTVICQSLRVREMRAVFSDLSMGTDDSSVALPSGFLDPIGLKDITNNIDLDLVPELEIVRQRQYSAGTLSSGTPTRFAIFNEAFQFDCKYSGAATITLVGFKKPTFISSSVATNFLTDRYPHLMRVACIAQAADFMNNNERADKYLDRLMKMIQQTNAESDLSYRGVALNMRAG